jgi:hypothetical protein
MIVRLGRRSIDVSPSVSKTRHSAIVHGFRREPRVPRGFQAGSIDALRSLGRKTLSSPILALRQYSEFSRPVFVIPLKSFGI